MSITTRNIQIDDMDKPNEITAPNRPDYRYTAYQPESKKHGSYTQYGIIAGVVVLLASSIYIARAIATYTAAVNTKVAWIDPLLLGSIKLVLALTIIATMCLAVLWLAAKVGQAAIVRMPNNAPMPMLEFMRNRQQAFIERTMDQWYTERGKWADNSMLWSVQTLDQSQSGASTRQQLPAQLIDQKSEEISIPKHQHMLEMLIDRGLIDRSGNSLLVGFNDKKPYYIELAETGMIALAGQPRVGKSSTAASIIAQVLLMHQSQVLVCDKHGKKADSLLTRLQPIKDHLYRSAIEIDDIIQTIDTWYEIGANRLAEDTSKQYPICMLVIDEFTALILLDMLPNATVMRLLSGAVEFPKVQCHGLIIGHQWTGKLLGKSLGAPLRRVTTQRIIHRIDPQDAEFLIHPSYAKQVQSLETGKALFLGASQATPLELIVPYMTNDDMMHLSTLLQRNSVRSNNSAPTTIDTRTIADLTIDERITLATILLKKRKGATWMYTQAQVRAIVNLRNEKIVDLSKSIGRS